MTAIEPMDLLTDIAGRERPEKQLPGWVTDAVIFVACVSLAPAAIAVWEELP